MRLVVPYRSHQEVRTFVDEHGLPTILLVFVPGVREGDRLEPAPWVTAEDIPRIRQVPSHIVPVGLDGSSEEINFRPGDRVILTSETPPALVWALARFAESEA